MSEKEKEKMETINVKGFVKEISKVTGYSQKDVNAVLEAAESVMITSLQNDKAVKIFKSLSVMPTIRSARKGINLSTNQPMDIPEKVFPKAKFSQNLKDILNK